MERNFVFMHIRKASVFFAAILLVLSLASSALAQGLPMNDFSSGPAPKDENYLSDTEYKDASISVQLYEGVSDITPYNYAHVKISHPSQLRTAPAGKVSTQDATFFFQSTSRGRNVAKAVNAVVAINGDFYTKTDRCQVLLRQGQQYRNLYRDERSGMSDLLVIDMQGNLTGLQNCFQKDYAAYYEENKENLYQVISFGPVLCRDGVSIIAENYKNNFIGAQKRTQRSAIAQIGPLEYLLITCEGPQTTNNKGGMTIYEFSMLCEELGKKHSESGCSLAFNLDGGNSSTLVFKGLNESGFLVYKKINCPQIERDLSDIIYFATLEGE